MENSGKKVFAIVVSIIVGLLILLLLSPFVIITEGNKGVVLTWGKATDVALESGIHFKFPIMQRVVEMSVRTKKYDVPQSLAYSKDGQTITISSAINYNLDPQAVVKTYKEVGESYEDKIIKPIVEDSIANRGLIKDTIQTTLRERLSPFNIIVTQYSMLNEDFDDSYEQAIRDKQVAFERGKEAENKTKVVEQEKLQSILRAQAEAETSRLQAEALRNAGADVVIEKIKAEAMLEAARKWKGDVPASVTVLGGDSGVLPLLNLK